MTTLKTVMTMLKTLITTLIKTGYYYRSKITRIEQTMLRKINQEALE